MKNTTKICIVIALCLKIVLECSGSYAANFVEVYSDERFLVSLDVSSLKDKGDYVTAWTKWIYRGDQLENQKKIFGKNVAYGMSLIAYKVSDNEFQILSWCKYSEDGNVVDTSSFTYSPDKYVHNPPGSIGETLREKVMALTNQ